LPTATISAGGATTFCNGDSVILTASSASTYLWNNNATTQNIKVKSSGNFSVQVTDGNGCSASSGNIFIEVNLFPIIPVITVNGKILISSSDSGNQWYLDGNIIKGATSQNYLVIKNGNYYVIVSNGNCNSTSPPYNFSTLHTEIPYKGNLLHIYPNPNEGKFKIKLENIESGYLKISDVTGKIIYNSYIDIDTEIDLSNHSYGVYSIQFKTLEKIYFGRVIIQ
jgi:hypothetical protein